MAWSGHAEEQVGGRATGREDEGTEALREVNDSSATLEGREGRTGQGGANEVINWLSLILAEFEAPMGHPAGVAQEW